MAEFNFLTESVQRKSVLYLYWKRLMWYNESVVLLVKVETVLMHSLHTTVFWYLYDWKNKQLKLPVLNKLDPFLLSVSAPEVSGVCFWAETDRPPSTFREILQTGENITSLMDVMRAPPHWLFFKFSLIP